MIRRRNNKVDARHKVLVWVLMLAVQTASFGCGPGPVIEDEDWMIGTFSTGGNIPCSVGDSLTRYVVHEVGRFDIILVYANTLELKRQARWEQREPGRIIVMRDESHVNSDPFPYPIRAGTEWEIVRSFECVYAESDEGVNQVFHKTYEIELDTGTRHITGSMTPGAMCITFDEDKCGQWPVARVMWCEGTEPPPDFAVE